MNVDRIWYLLSTFALLCEFGGVDVHLIEEVHPALVSCVRTIYDGSCISAQLYHIK